MRETDEVNSSSQRLVIEFTIRLEERLDIGGRGMSCKGDCLAA